MISLESNCDPKTEKATNPYIQHWYFVGCFNNGSFAGDLIFPVM